MAAPAGYRTWATADTVTATDFSTYLQDQIVGVFTSDSNRTSELASPAEGQVSYLTDSNTFEVYNGSAWVALLDADTISVSSGAYTITGNVTLGVDDTGVDLLCYGATSGVYSLWDQSADEWTFVGADLDMDDNAVIRLGTGDDLLVYSNGSNSFIDHNGDGDLWVRALGTGEELYLEADDNLILRTGSTAANRVTVDTNGLVGIGGTPSSELHLQGDQPTYKLTSTNAMDTSGGTETLADIDFEGQKNSLYRTVNRIRARQNGTWSAATADDADSAFEFYVNNGSGMQQMLTLTGTGLGIGQPRSTPGYSLDIEALNASTYARIRITDSYSSYSAAAWYIEGGSNAHAAVYMGDSGDVDIGSMIYYNSDNSLRFTVNAAERMRVDSGGNVNMYTSGMQLSLSKNSPTSMPTTTAAANLYFYTTNGYLYYSTSSGRFKTDVEDAADDYADKVLNLRPVWYRSLCRDDRKDWSHWGLIAEEVDAIDPRLVHYAPIPLLNDDGTEQTNDIPRVDAEGNPVYEQVPVVDGDGEPVLGDDGEPTYTDGEQIIDPGPTIHETDADGELVLRPDNVQYDRIVPLLINLIKRQDARIAALEAA